MTTKCCPKCFDPIKNSDSFRCMDMDCDCHTSPVSEVIAEAVKEFESKTKFGEGRPWAIDEMDTIAPSIKEWLTTTLNRVASVAREEGYVQCCKEYIDMDPYQMGAQAMKEKILAALPRDKAPYWVVSIITDL